MNTALCECGHGKADHPGPLPSSCENGMTSLNPFNGPFEPGYGCRCIGWKPARAKMPDVPFEPGDGDNRVRALRSASKAATGVSPKGPLQDDETPDLFDELMHPHGRCACGGEGWCAWCRFYDEGE